MQPIPKAQKLIHFIHFSGFPEGISSFLCVGFNSGYQPTSSWLSIIFPFLLRKRATILSSILAREVQPIVTIDTTRHGMFISLLGFLHFPFNNEGASRPFALLNFMCFKSVSNGHMAFNKFWSSLIWYLMDSKIYAHFMCINWFSMAAWNSHKLYSSLGWNNLGWLKFMLISCVWN